VPRATLRLTLACGNRCIFCSQHGLPAAALDQATIGRQLAALRATADELTFTGGEPTELDELFELVRAARAAGFVRVGMQTNGRRLSDRAYAQALADRGMTDLHLSIHGADALVHDYHTGIEGSFATVLAALGNARAAGMIVVATTVLTRSNFRALSPLPQLLASHGVSAWSIAVPHAAGRAEGGFDRVIPRLGLALPFALHAVASAVKLGLPAFIAGAPTCLLGPYRQLALATDEPRAFAQLCGDCGVRASCAGLSPQYLERFGGDELSAQETAPAAALPSSELARMFVGTGELASPAPGRAVPAPPGRARMSLPLLGKVRPATKEVSASSPKRSGEELREIFPGLFAKSGEG
jgi:hypothetical protein